VVVACRSGGRNQRTRSDGKVVQITKEVKKQLGGLEAKIRILEAKVGGMEGKMSGFDSKMDGIEMELDTILT